MYLFLGAIGIAAVRDLGSRTGFEGNKVEAILETQWEVCEKRVLQNTQLTWLNLTRLTSTISTAALKGFLSTDDFLRGGSNDDGTDASRFEIPLFKRLQNQLAARSHSICRRGAERRLNSVLRAP